MFIRSKVVKGVTYYSLVESYRQDGKVRQRTLLYLCRHPNLGAAIEREMQHLAFLRNPIRCPPGRWVDDRVAKHEERIKLLRHWQAVVTEKSAARRAPRLSVTTHKTSSSDIGKVRKLLAGVKPGRKKKV